MMSIRRYLLLALLAPLLALAQTYPARPLRIVVPFSAGGGADTVARSVSQKLAESLGQPVIVENRLGANGIIGADLVAKSAPDGYTLISTLGPSHHTIQFFSKNVPFDPVADFTGIIIVGTVPQVIVVHPSSSAGSMKELIDYARANPGKLSFGTSGVGTSQHLGGLLLNLAAKLDMVHVPYKGGAAALTDILGGNIPLAILVLSNVSPHLRTGKLRALGVLETRRARGAPAIPTVAEGGLPGYALPETWAGILGPAGMPGAIVTRLNRELRKAIETPEIRSRLETLGFDVAGNTPQEFAALLYSSVETYRRIVNEAGIKPE